MDELHLGGQVIQYDRQSTAKVYSSLTEGDADRCGCLYCRNFAHQRIGVYPEAVLALLEKLGIDPRCESEVWEYSPLSSGMHLYGGCFGFAGELVLDQRPPADPSTQQFAFDFWFATTFTAAPPELPKPLLAVEFLCQIPWVLQEAPE